MQRKDIGACLREIREKEKGLSSIELSKLVGIDDTTLTKIETGKIKNPSFDTIFKLVEVLSKTPAVRDNKVDFSKYDESVAKLFKAFIDMPDIEEKYKIDVLKQRLGHFYENMDYVSAEELNMINTFSLGKTHLVETQQAIKQFMDNIGTLVTDKVIGSIGEYDFTRALLLLLERNVEFRKNINSILKSIIIDGNPDEMAVFLPLIIRNLGSRENISLYKDIIENSMDWGKTLIEELDNPTDSKQLNELET